jgi:ankyrin repeat protein
MQAMERLLELGVNPDSPSAEGATPLMNAVQSNKLPHVSLLLEAGANVNAIDNRGFTSLHRAAEMGHLDIVITLLKSGADKKISSNGHTALSFAEMRGHEEIINVLRG